MNVKSYKLLAAYSLSSGERKGISSNSVDYVLLSSSCKKLNGLLRVQARNVCRRL